MKIKKYRAVDSQQALRMIRAELGPDASILTTYQVPEGVEIVVAIDTPDLVDADAPAARQASVKTPAVAPVRQKTDVAPAADQDLHSLRQELGSMRSLLERHLHRLAVREPHLAGGADDSLLSRLGSLGLHGQLAQRVQAILPRGAGAGELAAAVQTCLGDLARPLSTRTGITALIGTPGAGKTHIMATLALQHVLSHQAEPLFLVSMDTQRLGAREQLSALGRMLRLPVLFAADHEILTTELAQLPANARVIVDTAGIDAHDAVGIAALGRTLQAIGTTQRALVLPMDMALGQRERVLAAYAGLSPDGVIATRVDALDNLGELASWLLETGISWFGASQSRDPSAAWQAADADWLAERIAAAWQVPVPAAAAAVTAASEPVSRWSWTAQRASA